MAKRSPALNGWAVFSKWWLKRPAEQSGRSRPFTHEVDDIEDGWLDFRLGKHPVDLAAMMGLMVEGVGEQGP